MVPSHSVLERVLRPAEGDLPADFARKLLDMDFEPADHERYRELSAKAQSGGLTPQEQVDLDDLLTANDVLTILQAKARISLSHPSSAA
jgi:N-formylglutamate amidohydrolase